MKRVHDPRQLEVLANAKSVYQTLESARINEPRIDLIHRRLEALLRVVQLESGASPVEIDGFRLRDPAAWRSVVGSPISELWHISTACNMRCPFCYEEGDPPGSSVLNEPPKMTTMAEIEVRLKYRDTKRSLGVFQPITYINEIFCNPEAMDILERLRAAQPDEVLTFVTNGTYLDAEMVKRIAALKPVFFNLSVNSLDRRTRRKVLSDRNPDVVPRALELLAEHQVPYLGSLVCWPTIPWSDIRNTVIRLDEASCAVIRFSLGAYSRHLRGARWDRQEFWGEGLAVARELMQEVRTPIKVEPYHFHDPTFEPRVVGAVRGSPADRAGIRAGDELVQVNSVKVATANQALTALARARRMHERAEVAIRDRAGRTRYLALDDASGPFGYPYDPLVGLDGFEFGVILVENLKFGYLREIAEHIRLQGASRVLICSSTLMKPIVDKMIATTNPFPDAQVEVVVPENRWFGGTVALGDLLVADDYVTFLNQYTQAHGRVDLVVIPSSPFSLGQWGRDLVGVPRTDIARRTGLEIVFIEVRPLAG